MVALRAVLKWVGSEKRIENGMTSTLSLATRSMSVSQAWRILKEGDFRHLPVMEGRQVVGVVSERDLRQAVALADRVGLKVGEVMSADPYCVPIGTTLVDVARQMNRNKYGCAIVQDERGRIAGIFTRTDAMRILIELLEKIQRGAGIIVK